MMNVYDLFCFPTVYLTCSVVSQFKIKKKEQKHGTYNILLTKNGSIDNKKKKNINSKLTMNMKCG
ncbi:hypothetical protein Hdeb2414_s0024g00652191 [Helianthus debilis subsp. tardiflorus]